MKLRARDLPLLIACALLGAVLDFVFNGVFKIIWIVIYGPAYIVAAKVLAIQLDKSRWAGQTRAGVIALFVGAVAVHLTFVGLSRQWTYPMTLLDNASLTFRSADFPQTLVVSSPKLEKAMAGHSLTDVVPVNADAILDYGCFRSYRLSTVAGIDVRYDPEARWTWRNDTRLPDPENSGPGREDRGLPWCRFKFYRGLQ